MGHTPLCKPETLLLFCRSPPNTSASQVQKNKVTSSSHNGCPPGINQFEPIESRIRICLRSVLGWISCCHHPHKTTPQISEPAPAIDAIFLDTLYHFQETLDLVEKAKARYPNVHLHVYKPEGVSTAAEFEARHGKELWKTNADLYDWVAKVEPAQRAYSDLAVAAVLTGRRRSQGAKRESLDIIEIDEAGLIKINPLAGWSFKQVDDYIKTNNVPYNKLLDRGYKSVGDWHSTEPVKEGEDERAGRWKGQAKTECGIHNKRSKYAQFLYEAEQKRLQEELAAKLGEVELKQERIEKILA